MAEPKYVIATIKLPIEMLADGTFKTHADRADIGFVPCGSLPPINTELNSSAFDKLQELIGLDRGASRKSSIEINDSPMFVFKKIDSTESVAKINNEEVSGPNEITAQRDTELIFESLAPGTVVDSVCDAVITQLDEVTGAESNLVEPKQETEQAAIIDEVLKLFIKKEEINKKTTRSLSTSFKTRSKSSRSFTSKNRS